jgi:hypothetical protein
MMKTQTPWLWRYWLYPLVLVWLLWLYWLSNVFTMGYSSPAAKKVAISVAGILLPIALSLTKTKDGWIIAVLLALLTWLPILMLLVH